MRTCTLCLTAMVAMGCAGAANAQEDVYAKYNAFCLQYFGAEKEPLAYEIFGKDLKFLDEGQWVRPSATSACVAFETNLPAKAWVEYGDSDRYGKKTAEPERPFYVHVHHLTGLASDAEVHYRLVAVDERGKRIESKDMTLKTAAPAGALRIPGDVEGPPYVLSREGATYLVTKDLTVDGTAFEVTAKNVTLDLDGHTVVYDEKHWGPVMKDGKPSKSFPDWIKGAQYGLKAGGAAGLKIFNGAVVQGKGADHSEANSIGFNPMYISGGSGMEIAGMRIVYAGPQQVGIYNHWGGGDSVYHHNVFEDDGTEILNRHGAGSRALLFYGSRDLKGVRTHHNLVKRTRQGGVGGNEVFHNEVWMDSWATNSFGIATFGGGESYGNRVFGGGYHVCGFGWGNGLRVHDNYLHLRAHPFPEKRWPEYGQYASINAFRLTQYAGSKNEYFNNEYFGNVASIDVAGGRQSRGIQIFSDPYVKDFVFRDGTIKITAADEKTVNASCVVTQGNPPRTAEMLPVYYRNATFISNICNVKFGDGYGVGSNHQFINCRFVKAGDHAAYRTIAFESGYPSHGHVFLDCAFEDGASVDDVQWVTEVPDHNFTVQWTVTFAAAPNAKVAIADKDGKEVFSGQADAKGVVAVPLSQFTATAKGKIMHTPHSVTVEAGGARAEKEVTADGKKTIKF